jgi:hypothetical protein
MVTDIFIRGTNCSLSQPSISAYLISPDISSLSDTQKCTDKVLDTIQTQIDGSVTVNEEKKDSHTQPSSNGEVTFSLLQEWAQNSSAGMYIQKFKYFFIIICLLNFMSFSVDDSSIKNDPVIWQLVTIVAELLLSLTADSCEVRSFTMHILT